MPNLDAARRTMAGQRIDAWLVYDFRGSNQVLSRLLPPAGGRRFLTRRVFLLIPAEGAPRLLAHSLDASGLEREGLSGVEIERYTSWTQMRAWVEGALSSARRVAMEYSPGGALPVASIVDAGTIDLVRAAGVEVVSSADLLQAQVAAWSAPAVDLHTRASRKTERIMAEAMERIRQTVGARGDALHEHDVADFIRARFGEEGLEHPDGPIVAVGAHAADPHYEPSLSRPVPIRRGDWVLIDLWAREPGDENIYSDITWVARVASEATRRQVEVWEVVRRARDAAFARARAAWDGGERVEGWQLDDAAREVIVKAGLGDGLMHRTGHSLSPGPLVHGLGMNLDNLETRDTRAMLPGLGFTIEPGVYLPGERFGVRSEIDVYVDPETGPKVTSCVQGEIACLG
jgi:Xaa-Pro dipeptidase